MELRRYMVMITIIVAIVGTFLKGELIPGTSSYSFRLNILDCDNIRPLQGCRHEIGHKMDDDLGMPSQTNEFVRASQLYVIYQITSLEPSDLAVFMHLYPDKRPHEMYAGIYAYIEGDTSKLPEDLKPFFSNDPSYLKLYDCLTRNELLNLCGLSYSFLKG